MRQFLFAALGVATLAAAPALAEGQRFDPVDHPATLKECSACHMVYQPQMLPARSWEALMKGLDSHFGESAALDAATAEDITAYLTTNAAGPKSRWMRGIGADETPLRISETPAFARAHRELSDQAYKRPGVGSKSNCIACHTTADKGLYTEPGEGYEND